MDTGTPGVKNSVHMEFPSLPENVGFARASVAFFASQLDFTLDELDEIKVAVSEAVSNAVVHGYPQGPGPVVVDVSATEAGELVVQVADRGTGIEDVEQACQTSFTTRPGERLGLGLTFIKEYADRLEVTSRPGEGTVVTFRKRPQPAAVSQG
ncbi:anti-sigma F factor [Limnochorda pilosa]|uniref:ATPase n=1 Tax=Limnochorda pilosa TaxID=1555112 RepID=A0A0K2SKB2_LIMPI|nr:anti-sigma F factor [Limnochorda pilosa]BAS27553.1 ATPase [Limnochorda pilosa]